MVTRKEREIDVIVAGHICLDITPAFPEIETENIEQLLIPGKLLNVGKVAISTGGPVPNTGLAAHRLGLKVELMSKLGDDLFGKTTLDLLRQSIPVRGMHIVNGEASSYTIVIAPQGIDRIFLHNPGPNNTFGYEDINFNLVSKAKLFHLGYPPLMKHLYEKNGEELFRIFKKAKESGATTSLDVSLPDSNSESGKVDWQAILEKILPYVDIFLPSFEEILYMLEKEKFFKYRSSNSKGDIISQIKGDDLTRLSEKMLEFGTNIAVIKCGYKGFYVRTANRAKFSKIGYARPGNLENWSSRELWHSTYHVDKIVSATGSGDSAIAGFLAAYIKGETIENALKYACAFGAQNLRVLDALSGLKSWNETKEEILLNPLQDKLEPDTDGWKFDSSYQAWKGPNEKQL
jgi:sugar/nucleoside kinase (ribokinase family)